MLTYDKDTTYSLHRSGRAIHCLTNIFHYVRSILQKLLLKQCRYRCRKIMHNFHATITFMNMLCEMNEIMYIILIKALILANSTNIYICKSQHIKLQQNNVSKSIHVLNQWYIDRISIELIQFKLFSYFCYIHDA